jgi:hypothetical protein
MSLNGNDQPNINIAAGGIGVRAHLMGLFHQGLRLLLIQPERAGTKKPRLAGASEHS